MRRTVLLLLIISSCAPEENIQLTEIETLHSQIRTLWTTDSDQALLLADQVIELAQSAGDQYQEAKGFFMKGFVYWNAKELSNALDMYTEAITMLEGEEDAQSVKTYLDLLVNTGAVLRKSYKYNEAILLYDKGLLVATKEEYPKMRQKLLYNKSYTLWEKGQSPAAIETLEESVMLAAHVNDSSKMFKCFNLFGVINSDNGFYDAAREYYQFILNSPLANLRTKAIANHNMGYAYMEEGNYPEAVAYFDKALIQKEALDKPELTFNTLHDLAELHLKQRDTEQAAYYALKAELLYSSLFHGPDEYDIYRLQSAIYEMEEDLKQANKYLKRAYNESQLFTEYQAKILKKLKQHEMDLILIGIEKKREAESQQFQYHRNLIILSYIIGALLLFGTAYYIRRRIKRKELRIIFDDLAKDLKNVNKYIVKQQGAQKRK